MTITDLLELVPSGDSFDISETYKLSLSYLNKLKCSRYNAMYFGSMAIADNNFFSYKNKKDFLSKYYSACMYVMGDLYDKEAKNNTQVYIETSLFVLHSLLSSYTSSIEYTDKELTKLLKENDKYKSTVDLKEESK